MAYFGAAADPTAAEPNHWTLRIGLILPVHLAIRVIGYSEVAYYAIPFAAGIGLLVGTYALGRALFSHSVGLAAGLLGVMNPYVLIHSSELFPDLAATAAFTGALALVVMAATARRRGVLLITAGFLLGWAYLARELIVVLFPLVAVAFAAYRIPWRELRFVMLPIGIALGLELAWGLVVHGDALIHAKELLGRTLETQISDNRALLRANIRSQQGSVIGASTALPRVLLSEAIGPMFLGLLALTALAAGVLRERAFVLLAAWAFGLWALFTVIGLYETPSGGSLLRLDGRRYWYPLFPPILLGGLGAITRLMVTTGRSRIAIAAASLGMVPVISLLFSLVTLPARPIFVSGGADGFLRLREWLAEHPSEEQLLWTDHITALIAAMYTRTSFGSPIWHGEVTSFSSEEAFLSKPPQDGLVLISFESIERIASGSTEVPEYLLAPPQSWDVQTVLDGDSLLYRLGGPSSLREIYSVGQHGQRTWQALPRNASVSLDLRDGLSEVRLAEGDSAVIVDDAGRGLRPPQRFQPDLQSGQVARIRTLLGAEGSGRASFFCHLFTRSGERLRIDGLTLFASNTGVRRTEIACVVPTMAEGPFQLRVGLIAKGPLQLQLGGLTTYADDA